ncbi:MAG: DEAD/DEAH box helicase family protein [Rickettsiales bacterium]
MDFSTLHTEMEALEKRGLIPCDPIPVYVAANLAPNVTLRPYQEQAIRRFFFEFGNSKGPKHWLFHMATGSGKTVVMAALILALYAKGYRRFLFFVPSDTIIKKTKANFLDKRSSKYLFADSLRLDDREIFVKEAENFEGGNGADIHICFTTIQGLHRRMNDAKENAVTLEDFIGKDVVMISDEAHHINADTKKKIGKNENEENRSWEETVRKIFAQSPGNVLLEFTATLPREQSVAEKYRDKILFDYPLRQFRKDRYSKEVHVIDADSEKIDRAFFAVILSQYRRKIAEKHGVAIKPVILFKSKRINESKAFREEFHQFIEALTPERLRFARQALTEPPFPSVFRYFDAQGVTDENLIREIQGDFSPEKTLNVNDPKELEANQIRVNSLEDRNNEIRAVFAVDKLNEGWDVLNLFDIVRLYDTRDFGKNGGETTTKEAQLIGRGARYCPFSLHETDERDKRKYDGDSASPLRILEELHYHSPRVPKYITELKAELRRIGIMEDERIEKPLRVKERFKQTDFWKQGYIFLNEQRKTNIDAFLSLKDYRIDRTFRFDLKTDAVSVTAIFEDGEEGGEKLQKENRQITGETIELRSFGPAILRSALDGAEFFRLHNMRGYFSRLNSASYFIEREEFIADVRVELIGTEERRAALSPKTKRHIVSRILAKTEATIKAGHYEWEGTKNFLPQPVSETLRDKILTFAKDASDDKEYGKGMGESLNPDFCRIDLTSKDWFVYNDCYGTKEEKHFVRYIHDNEAKIRRRYKEFYVIRNEKLFRIYSIEGGRAIEPDFVLFFRERNGGREIVRQMFVEPKGEHLTEHDRWKERFLKAIDCRQPFEGQEYLISGLPFFTESRKWEFIDACERALGINGTP